MEFVRAYPPAKPTTNRAIWLPFVGDKLIVSVNEAGEKPTMALLEGEIEELLVTLAPLNEPLYLGTLAGVPCLTSWISPDIELSTGWQPNGLRNLYGRLDEAAHMLAGYAYQMVEWQRTSRHCSVCSSLTEAVSGDWAQRCTNPECGYMRYPPLSPAVLVLIHDGGNKLLLTHKAGWGQMYSIIAGFVEPGESLEECVVREVEEEVGLLVEIADLTYFGSQPWPFPHQLMIGFMARWNGTVEIGTPLKIDTQELDDALWFEPEALPVLPGRLSLSRQLIESWLTSRRPESLASDEAKVDG